METHDLISAARHWMSQHAADYATATALAEDCAAALDLYEERVRYSIPELLYDLAILYRPLD